MPNCSMKMRKIPKFGKFPLTTEHKKIQVNHKQQKSVDLQGKGNTALQMTKIKSMFLM